MHYVCYAVCNCYLRRTVPAAGAACSRWCPAAAVSRQLPAAPADRRSGRRQPVAAGAAVARSRPAAAAGRRPGTATAAAPPPAPPLEAGEAERLSATGTVQWRTVGASWPGAVCPGTGAGPSPLGRLKYGQRKKSARCPRNQSADLLCGKEGQKPN